MNNMSLLTNILTEMQHNTLGNYIIPGLTSSLVGGIGGSKIRIFEIDRESRDWITPHSHRFNFAALVLEGWVENTIFTKSDYSGDLWCKSTIGQVCDENGITNYRHERENVATRYTQKTTIYYKGDIYSMHFNEIHSIKFSSGAKVLLFEGIKQTHISEMLEPWVNGKVIPTFKTENWMFEKINEPIKQDDDKENNNVA